MTAAANKPKGEPLRQTAEVVASFSQVRPEDIASARALWYRAAPKPLKRLLDAR